MKFTDVESCATNVTRIDNTPTTRFKRPSLKFFFFVTLLVSTLLLSTIYVNTNQDIPPTDGKSSRFGSKSIVQSLKGLFYRPPKRPLILLWTQYFSAKDWLPNLNDLGCSNVCEVTSNRSLLKESNAVLFHLRNVDESDLPPARVRGQKWVLFNKEAPPHTPKNLFDPIEGRIHWIISFRRDSDFYAPYGVVIKKKHPEVQIVKPSGKHKDRLVCWIVSNCNTPSDRESYVKLLKSHIPVYIYGHCGNESCSPHTKPRECYTHVASRCKFYLSFENSICADYSTEKLYFALGTDMVPVVMGGENYKETLPPHSFIDAGDYPDPQDLASLLLQLDKNDAKYAEYHRWKRDYVVKDWAYMWACDLCGKLVATDKDTDVEVREGLASWWFDKSMCRSWSEQV